MKPLNVLCVSILYVLALAQSALAQNGAGAAGGIAFLGFFAIWFTTFFGILAFYALIFFMAVFGSVFWLWMLVDLLKRDFKKSDDKIVWVLVVIFTHFIGATLYYLMVKRKS